MAYGDPAPDQECWFRALTNETHVTRDGRLHYQALKGLGAISPSIGQAWSHELSGRAVSLAGSAADIAAHAEERVRQIRQKYIDSGKPVPSKIKLAGFAYGKAAELRTSIEGHIATDVLYTPDPASNVAHSDFVTYQTITDSDLALVRDFLLKTLRVVEPNSVTVLIASCGSPTAAASTIAATS